MPEKLKKGWRTWRFDQMAVMVNDRIDNPSESGVDRYVGLEHLDSDSLTIRRWGTPSDVEATKLRFRSGDIILGRRRVYQRKLGVADFDGICSAHAMVLRARTDVVLPEFLPFFMQSDLFMERAKQISVGSLSPTINWKTLAAEEFSLPPLGEQRKIAEVLDALRDAREAIIDAEQRGHTLRHAHLKNYFEPRFRNGIPVSKVAHVVAGSTPSKANAGFWGGSLPWASAKDLKCRKLSQTEDRLTEDGWRDATIAPRGSTLIVVRGMILAHTFPVARCEHDTAFNQDLRALHAKEGLDSDYLLLWTEWAAPWFLSCCAASSHGTKRIEGRVFNQALIPVPSLTEQRDVVAKQNVMLQAAGRLAERVMACEALRKSAMLSLIGGTA